MDSFAFVVLEWNEEVQRRVHHFSTEFGADVSLWWFWLCCQLHSSIHHVKCVLDADKEMCNYGKLLIRFFGIWLMHFVLSTWSDVQKWLSWHLITHMFTFCLHGFELSWQLARERRENSLRKKRNLIEKRKKEETNGRRTFIEKKTDSDLHDFESHFGRTWSGKLHFWNWMLSECLMLSARRHIFKTARFGRWECSLVSHSHVAS